MTLILHPGGGGGNFLAYLLNTSEYSHTNNNEYIIKDKSKIKTHNAITAHYGSSLLKNPTTLDEIINHYEKSLNTTFDEIICVHCDDILKDYMEILVITKNQNVQSTDEFYLTLDYRRENTPWHYMIHDFTSTRNVFVLDYIDTYFKGNIPLRFKDNEEVFKNYHKKNLETVNDLINKFNLTDVKDYVETLCNNN